MRACGSRLWLVLGVCFCVALIGLLPNAAYASRKRSRAALPRLQTSVPSKGARDVSIDTALNLSFDQSVDPSAGVYQLKRGHTHPSVILTNAAPSETLTFSHARLDANTSYTFTARGLHSAADGRRMKTVTIRFRTVKAPPSPGPTPASSPSPHPSPSLEPSPSPGPGDHTSPAVVLLAPTAGAAVSGTASVSASASDDSGIAGVQFRVDGQSLGTEDTVAPYSNSWDTTSVANGAHTLTATARDTAGNTAVATISVNVSNPVINGRLIEIGPGKQFAHLLDIDWTALSPGDTVKVYYKPGGYHEKVFITTSGTAASPIRIIGVPDAGGHRPVIDGDNALSPAIPRRNQDLAAYRQYYEGLALVLIDRASYVELSNFQVQGAYSDVNRPSVYFNSAAARTDWGFSGGVYLLYSSYVTVDNNVITNNGDGFFINSNYAASAHNRVTRNYLYGNGAYQSYLFHNWYTESDDLVAELNRFGALRSGSAGTCGIKTRDTNAVIRYNLFDATDSEPGRDVCARMLDAVEIQGSGTPQATPLYVYGNVFKNDGSSVNPIHFAAENDPTMAPNNKTMHFYNNTYVYDTAAADWRAGIFDVGAGYTVNAENNIFYWNASTVNPAFMWNSGTLHLTRNWISGNILDNTDRSSGTVTRSGTVTNGQNFPGFVAPISDLHLAPGAQAIGTGGPIGAGLLPVLQEYVDQSGAARADTNDLGAYRR